MLLSPFYQWENGLRKIGPFAQATESGGCWGQVLTQVSPQQGSCPAYSEALPSRFSVFSPVGLPSSYGPKTQHICFVSCCPMCSSFTPLPESDRTASDLARSHQAYRRFEYPFAPFREGILSESPELQGQWSDTGPCFDSQQVILLNFIISSLPASHAGKGISRGVHSAPALFREGRTQSIHTWSHLSCSVQQAFFE